jgi:hypothetical protein
MLTLRGSCIWPLPRWPGCFAVGVGGWGAKPPNPHPPSKAIRPSVQRNGLGATLREALFPMPLHPFGMHAVGGLRCCIALLGGRCPPPHGQSPPSNPSGGKRCKSNATPPEAYGLQGLRTRLAKRPWGCIAKQCRRGWGPPQAPARPTERLWGSVRSAKRPWGCIAKQCRRGWGPPQAPARPTERRNRPCIP